jgi:hypothetical protein
MTYAMKLLVRFFTVTSPLLIIVQRMPDMFVKSTMPCLKDPLSNYFVRKTLHFPTYQGICQS